jgi:hypothetical protein
VPVTATGKLNELLNLNPVFESVVSAAYGFQRTSKVFHAEGVVIRPIFESTMPIKIKNIDKVAIDFNVEKKKNLVNTKMGDKEKEEESVKPRLMFKFKNPAYVEVFKQNQTSEEKKAGVVKPLYAKALKPYINSIRFDNLFAKLTEVEKQKSSFIVEQFSKDVLDDFLIDGQKNDDKNDFDFKILEATCTDLVTKFLIGKKIINKA